MGRGGLEGEKAVVGGRNVSERFSGPRQVESRTAV